MWLADVDKDGNITKLLIRDVDKPSYVYQEKHRLVVDPTPMPHIDYNPRFVTPVRVQPVTGDVIEYVFEEKQLEIVSPEEQEIMDNCLEKAKEFFDSKGIDSANLYYFVTTHNATLCQDIAMTFRSVDNVNNVKVSLLTNSVSEWYQVGNFEIDGQFYFGVSKDLNTSDIIDKYRMVNAGQEKLTPDNSPVMTFSYETNPTDPEQARLLSEFQYKDYVTGWSHKYYGFIIQYDRLVKQR
jgi:hypothetical protein